MACFYKRKHQEKAQKIIKTYVFGGSWSNISGEPGYVGSESSKVRLFYPSDLFKINKKIYIHHVLLSSSLSLILFYRGNHSKI